MPSYITLYYILSFLLFIGSYHGFYTYHNSNKAFHRIITMNSRTFSAQEIERYALCSGLILKIEEKNGIFLKIEVFPINSNENLKPIGYLNAFIRPFGLLHLDTIQVKNHRQNLGYKRNNWKVDGPGISFILGSLAIKWAYDKGCQKAELLAVNDNDIMHNILIRLYESFGFKQIRYVGEGMESISDRLVWGAVGTLMSMDLQLFYNTWTPKFYDLLENAEIKSKFNDNLK